MRIKEGIKESYTLVRYFAAKIKYELGQNMTLNRIKRITKMLNWIVILLSTVTILKMKR